MATGAFSIMRSRVEAPEIIPVGGGLLTAAQVVTVSDSDPEMRGYFFDSDAAEVTLGTVGFTGAIGSTAKMTEGNGVHETDSQDPFTIYASFATPTPVWSADQTRARAESRLAFAEPLAVEQAFWNQTLEGATVLRAGTAMKPSRALGLIAEYMGSNYLGVPFFHAGRRVANEIAAAQLSSPAADGVGPAAVKGGGVFVNGAGYTDKSGPAGATAGSVDQAWLYATGVPMLVRGDVNVEQAPDYRHNHDAAFAFRTYVPSFDGPSVAVLVDLT